MNFTSGKVQRPSKNIGQQTVFRPADPYAGESQVMDAINNQRLTSFGSPGAMQPGAYTNADAQAWAGQYQRPMPSPFGPPAQPMMGLMAASMQQPVDPYARFGGLNQNVDIRNAAQLFGQSLTDPITGGPGNPFIDPEELARMRAGYVPLEQGINPAFYRYTSPVIQQALAGLRQSVGYRPEDAQFIARQFTPGGLF